MIFSGLEFGRYFEINKQAGCYTILIALSPLARIIFVLMQMLYVFSNNKVTEMSFYETIGAIVHSQKIYYEL